MTSVVLNVTSVTSVTLDGFLQLSDHRLLFFFVCLAAFVFVLFSDFLVVYLVVSRRSLHRPMYMFVAAVLLNSVAASVTVYPKLLSDLSGGGVAHVSRSACLCQAFVLYSLGSSSFMLLAAMAFDRYLSICRPLRYAALASPSAVAALLLLCWLLPACLVGGAALLASRLPLCRSRLDRIHCDIYSFVRLSCGGGAALLSEVYGLLCAAATVFLPAAFVLFSYGRILTICLRRSRTFSSKALHTCLPHLLVFLNYCLCTAFDLLHRRLHTASDPAASVVTSVLVVLVPTVLNPVVYGLKVKEIFTQVKKLLRCQTQG
ncbi:olfactory receptor 11A1-like [Thunnus thynnus]|uniref:olfactory receptor 11A1-like n=1 Tax=Thunnus thynnus TaxID=8237 RepID=UPI003527C310